MSSPAGVKFDEIIEEQKKQELTAKEQQQQEDLPFWKKTLLYFIGCLAALGLVVIVKDIYRIFFSPTVVNESIKQPTLSSQIIKGLSDSKTK